MSCPVCGDNGLMIQEWTDAPSDFLVCLCSVGQAWRVSNNNGRGTLPLWRVWCAKWQIDPARVFLLEDIYTPAELAAAGLSKQQSMGSPEAAMLAAGKRAKR